MPTITKKTDIDMTIGSPAKQILRFSIPLLMGNILQQLYNTVDSMVVGNFVGADALAAVGASGSFIHLMVSFFMGISVGTSVLVSQAAGRKDEKALSTIIHTCVTLTLLAAAVIAVIGVLLTPTFLRLLNTPEDIFDMAATYMRITFIGIISLMMYNILTGIFQGTGDARSPFIFLLISSCINIVLDLLFVAVFSWGCAGVAWATIIAQCCSALFAIWKINRRPGPRNIHLHALRLDKATIIQVLKIGVPTGLSSSLLGIGNIAVMRVLNSFGTVAIAANTAVIKIDSFCTMPMMSFASAVTVFVGQNVGAKKYQRIHDGTRSGLVMSISVSIAVSLFLVLIGPYALRLFTPDTAVVQAGMDKIYRIAPFYFTMGIYGILSGVLRGMGKTIPPTIVSITSMLIARIPVAYLLSNWIGVNGVHWSLSANWAIEAVMMIGCYLYYKHAKNSPFHVSKEDENLVNPDLEVKAESEIASAEQ